MSNANLIQARMTVFDLKSTVYFGHSYSFVRQKGMVNEYGSHCLYTTDGLPAEARVRQMRPAVSRQLSSKNVLMSRSIPLHGVRSTHLPG